MVDTDDREVAFLGFLWPLCVFRTCVCYIDIVNWMHGALIYNGG